jgi:hypothetical protein
MTTVISAGGAGSPATYGVTQSIAVGAGGAGSCYNTISGTIGNATLIFGGLDMEDILDRHCFNKITVEHKVAEFELAKLKETVPTYADEIKENLSKNLARDIIKKTTFTKKHNVDSDTHHFLGRVWVFTEDELKNLIQGVRNA